MGVSDLLKNSQKGRLSYERSTTGSQVKSLLEECASPPKLQVSPNFIRNVIQARDQEQGDKEDKFHQDKEACTPGRESPQSVSSSDLDVQYGTCRPSPITSPEFGKSKLAIEKYKEELDARTRLVVLQKQRDFEYTRNRIEYEAFRNIQQLDQKANFDTLMRIQSLELSHESQAAEIVKQHRKLKETHEQRKQAHDARIQEAEQVKEKLKQEDLKRKELARQDRLQKISRCVSDLNQLTGKLQAAYTACKYEQFVSDAGRKAHQLMNKLSEQADAINRECQEKGDVTPDHFEKCRNLLDQAGNAYEFVKKELDKAEKEAIKAQEAENKARQEAAAAERAQATAAAAGTSTASTVTLPAGQSLCVDVEAFKHYTELQDRMKAMEQEIQGLSSTPQLKKLKFDLQRAVNTPINAISPVSGDHLRDKLKRLLALLSGKTVELSGKQISITQHPLAEKFCKNLIAKMIVKKGEEQVSSKHDSAFAIAMVAVGLWREQPDMGDLFLAHFQAVCPYLVPYYVPRQEGQSDKEFFMSRGYKYYEDGGVEKQDKFLKRMSGVMCLYFSIIVSSPPRGSHPHGIEHAWLWLTRVLNINPEPDITATMIYDFLQVTGHALCKEYRKQFLKLLHILVKEMLPKLKDVSSTSGGGSLQRLQILLENSVKNHGNIPEPEGYLPAGFWKAA